MYLLASMFPEKRVMEITMGIIMVVTMAVTIIRIDSIIEDDIIKRNHHLSLWDLVRSLGFFMFFSNLCYKTKAIILFKSSYNNIRYSTRNRYKNNSKTYTARNSITDQPIIKIFIIIASRVLSIIVLLFFASTNNNLSPFQHLNFHKKCHFCQIFTPIVNRTRAKVKKRLLY